MEHFVMSAEDEAWIREVKEIQKAKIQKHNAELTLEYYGVR